MINKTKTSPLWVNSVIISDVPHLFSNAREQWKSDGVFVSHIIDIKDNNINVSDSTLIWLHLENYHSDIVKESIQNLKVTLVLPSSKATT